MSFLYNNCVEYDAIILASGKGERARLGYNKTFYKMKDGKTVLEHSASLFLDDDDCKRIIVVTSIDYLDQVFKNDKVITVIGGKERRDSVENGLSKVISEYVLIHDAARPFLHKQALQDVKNEVVISKATILARKATDTIKLVKDLKIEKTIDRDTIYLAETPQAFASTLIKKCYEDSEKINFTDDASLVESLGYTVSITVDNYDNKKLTTQEDFKNI